MIRTQLGVGLGLGLMLAVITTAAYAEDKRAIMREATNRALAAHDATNVVADDNVMTGGLRGPTQEQCRAADAILALWAKNPSIPHSLIANAPPRPAEYYSFDTLSSGWIDGRPPHDLLKKFYDAPARSSVECASVVDRARQAGYPIARSSEIRKPGLFEQIGAPVLSADGKAAIAYVLVSNPHGIGGSNSLIYFRRSNGEWRVVGVRPLSIS